MTPNQHFDARRSRNNLMINRGPQLFAVTLTIQCIFVELNFCSAVAHSSESMNTFVLELLFSGSKLFYVTFEI
jgi:hypothetical protein